MARKKTVILFIWLFSILSVVNGILNGNDAYKDISDDSAFGCRWHSDGTLSCSCADNTKEFFIQKNSIRSVNLFKLIINGCNKVRFGSEAIRNMRNLRHIELKNIRNLNLEESSLLWEGYVENNRWDDFRQTPTLQVTIENTEIEKISSYTFKGKISSIILKTVIVRHVSAFAFINLMQNERIEMNNANFQQVEQQMFKKFNTQFFLITNSNFEVLPSKTLMDINVYDSFLIRNSTFKDIRSGAFIVNDPQHFEVVNSKINVLEGEGFKVRTFGDVLFSNNIINSLNRGAFLGLSSSKTISKYFILENNTFEEAQPLSFSVNTSSFTPRFSGINLRVKCHCDIVGEFLIDPNLQDLSCLEGGVSLQLKTYKEDYCSTKFALSVTIVIVCVCVAVLVLVIAFLIYCFKKRFHSGKYGGKHQKDSHPEKVIMPEGKTYRETEIMYIVERADLLTTDL